MEDRYPQIPFVEETVRVERRTLPGGDQSYVVVIDGAEFCATQDTNEGFDLMVSVAKLKAMREERR